MIRQPFLWCAVKSLALSCAFALAAASAPVAIQPVPCDVFRECGATADGLRMAIKELTAAGASGDQRAFQVALENTGAEDAILNLGYVVGMDMVPSAIKLLVTNRQGLTRELRYFDRRGGIAGQVNDYIVRLRAGSRYCMRLTWNEYMTPVALRSGFPPGRYRIAARFAGLLPTRPDTPGTKSLHLWNGTLHSNSIDIDIR